MGVFLSLLSQTAPVKQSLWSRNRSACLLPTVSTSAVMQCTDVYAAGNCFMMVCCSCILGEFKVQVLSLRNGEEVRVNHHSLPRLFSDRQADQVEEDVTVEEFSAHSAVDSAVW